MPLWTIQHETDYNQARDIDPMLLCCWSGVFDAGPAAQQHWVNVSKVLGNTSRSKLFMFNSTGDLSGKYLTLYCLKLLQTEKQITVSITIFSESVQSSNLSSAMFRAVAGMKRLNPSQS